MALQTTSACVRGRKPPIPDFVVLIWTASVNVYELLVGKCVISIFQSLKLGENGSHPLSGYNFLAENSVSCKKVLVNLSQNRGISPVGIVWGLGSKGIPCHHGGNLQSASIDSEGPDMSKLNGRMCPSPGYKLYTK